MLTVTAITVLVVIIIFVCVEKVLKKMIIKKFKNLVF